jgi:proteasome lid subunit RPN8/RPN11
MVSSQFTINCSDEMMKKIEDHCFSETKVEVGGFLVGYLKGDTAYVTNVFPAKHSVGAAMQLTFTHDSWSAIYEQLEKEPEGSTLIGWFHSHPNFGVFLSDHDKFIQSNFFKQDGQITIVVDPIRGRRGWFYSNSGKIETYKKEEATTRKRLGVSDSNADQNIEAMLGGGKQGVSLIKVIAISGVMSLISFAAGWSLTTSSNSGSASQATVNQLITDVETIKSLLVLNGIGAPQVPTKPTAPPAPTKSATPKATTTPKTPSTPKASATPIKAVAGKPCTQGQKDPKKKLECVKVADKKFEWRSNGLAAPAPTIKPPTSDSATAKS